ncbi:substrate-binding domain-containing protein [Yersinia enterocolitica]|uniref:substrate-binding domain-containing protein n=1 Tax=Yersinia enterocolitica TaxID=630 RepID=UPI0005E45A88|nr:substrate-binding domain-containing protein [Yersinia enterocolitica]CNK76406.1 LacI family transcriptional regulatory protein [Yersinia enterocolitica]CRY02306.1 LacI family transcriptional regulatory protein [Yersinia enterocolitica]CRY15524.1 LacI family transcriptional regulatory protein [Yersinia enterocolitica]HDL8510926.1 substrate-binding domain-containing protein [Yersinia enterocolitica]HDQ4771797.1 substrate-binding domain-containing protein [Yersinia enterocolitica]
MKNQRVTLQDIALLAGVTKMTVSRYLRTPEKVAPETGERIAQVMAEVNYSADSEGETSLNQKSPRIGILVPSFNNQIFSDLLAGIESVTATSGYQTLVVNYNYNKEREEEQIVNLLSCQISGLILTDSEHTLRADKYLNASELPVAQVMDLEPQFNRITVGFNNYQAAYDMTATLLASGKQNVVYFGSMSDVRDRKRYQGYSHAMTDAGLAPLHITPNKVSSVSIGAGMLALARQMYPQVDAIFCTNDDMAVGVLQECLKLGMAVPAEMAISGFHGLDIGQATTPVLASVTTPRFEMGKVAAEILIKKIKKIPTIEQVDLHYRISLGGTI